MDIILPKIVFIKEWSGFMEDEQVYLVPDFYDSFKCKMGDCRAACCRGWPVSLNMKNYFTLLGVDCSSELRRRLDCGMRLADNPDENEYAQFCPRYDGECPLRASDGSCELQNELGEGMLPDVCRLYPRGVRVDNKNGNECSLANSCEAVIELLFSKTEPITFVERSLNIIPPENIKREDINDFSEKENKLRMLFIGMIQDRSKSLPQRIMSLLPVFEKLDKAISEKNFNFIDRIIDKKETFDEVSVCTPTGEGISFALEIARQMTENFAHRSSSIREHASEILETFGESGKAVERYYEMSERFKKLFPNWEIFFENMLVNHMFFSQFMSLNNGERFRSEFSAICSFYALLRFLSLGWMYTHDKVSNLVDICSLTFRFIDHTDFDKYASYLLKKLGCDTYEKLAMLISL